MEIVRQAFLPAAGYGRRLRPLTDTTPKPLLPVAGRPLVHHVMDRCLEAGILRFVVNTHHLAEAFPAAFPGGAYRSREVILVEEETLLDTGGGLKNAQPCFWPEPLLIHNADILTDLDLPEFLARAADHPAAEAVLAVRTEGPEKRVGVGEGGVVRSLREPRAQPGEKLCQYLGICLIRPAFWLRLQLEAESLVEGWKRAIAAGDGLVQAVMCEEANWIDIGSVESYRAVSQSGLPRASGGHE